jgi:phage FluMu protein Com
MANGICPHCEKQLNRVKFEFVKIDASNRRDVPGYSLRCSECDGVLSVAFMPEAADTLLRKKR